MAAKTSVPGQFALPLLWVGVDDADIHYANQIIVQPGEGTEFFVTFGQVAPPLLLGLTPEENLERAKQIAYVPVRTVARLGLTLERMEQFTEVMQRVLSQHKELKDQEKRTRTKPRSKRDRQ